MFNVVKANFGAKNELEKTFDRLFTDFWNVPWSPPVDFAETEESYILSMELPGVSKDEVDILIEGDILKISGEKKKNTTYQKRELKFSRSFWIPKTADRKKISAKLDNGILTVSLQKTSAIKPQKILIA